MFLFYFLYVVVIVGFSRFQFAEAGNLPSEIIFHSMHVIVLNLEAVYACGGPIPNLRWQWN